VGMECRGQRLGGGMDLYGSGKGEHGDWATRSHVAREESPVATAGNGDLKLLVNFCIFCLVRFQRAQKKKTRKITFLKSGPTWRTNPVLAECTFPQCIAQREQNVSHCRRALAR